MSGGVVPLLAAGLAGALTAAAISNGWVCIGKCAGDRASPSYSLFGGGYNGRIGTLPGIDPLYERFADRCAKEEAARRAAGLDVRAVITGNPNERSNCHVDGGFTERGAIAD